MAGYSLPVSQFNLIKKAPEIFTLTTQQIKLIEEDEEKSRLIRNTDSYRDKLLRINAAVLSPLFTFRETTNFQNNIDPEHHVYSNIPGSNRMRCSMREERRLPLK